MKHHKSYLLTRLLVIVLSLVVSQSLGQEVKSSWNINAGITISTFAFSGDEDFSDILSDAYTSQVGYQLGLGGIIPIKGKVSLKPELQLITRGSAFESVLGEGKSHEKLMYLSIPVLLSVSVSKLSIDFGPSVGFLLSARKKTDMGTTDYDFYDETFDFGVIAGLGYDITKKFHILARYYIGIESIKDLSIADQSNNKTEVDYKNRTLQIGLAYKLN